MSNSTEPYGGTGPQWWLSNQGTPEGPHSQAYIVAGLQARTISPQVYACPVGGQQWKRLAEWSAFASVCPAPPPPPPPQPPPLPGTASSVARTPWNPRTIAWLGLIFSPIWAGIMAALNARRLGLSLPIWRPIAIGVGATFLDVFVDIALFESWLFSVLLYCGTVWLIWQVDLRLQEEPYQQQRRETNLEGAWLVPTLAGSPAALIVFLGFIVSPLLPLEPREVCERFVAAGSLDEAKEYATTNLWPALEALDSVEDEEASDEERFDLTGEAPAPAEVGGYLVGYRMYWREIGVTHTVVGFFHLVDHEGAWKIEDWYWSAIDNQAFPEPVSMAANYREILADLKPQGRVTGSGSGPSGLWDAASSYVDEHPETQRLASGVAKFSLYGLLRKGGKGILIGIGAVILAILSAIGKALTGKDSTSGES